MLALNKITWARISACNVIPRLLSPGEICRNFSKTIGEDLPPKPKKPTTPFLRYLLEHRSSIIKEYPNVSWRDIMKIAAEKWRLCSPEDKKPYEESYLKEKENYFYVRNDYESKLTDDQKIIIQEVKEEMSKKREKKRVKKGMAELGKPKTPPGYYALFFATKKGQKIPGETLLQWTSRVAAEWKNLPEIEKQPYVEQAKALRIQYEKDIDIWRKEALQVESKNPVVKKAQRTLKVQEERHRDKLLNVEPPPELLAAVNTESTFCRNSEVSESKSVVSAKTSEPGSLLTESEETVSVQTKLIEPSSRNSAITKTVSFILSFYQRLIESASRITSWDFSKLRKVAKTMKNNVFRFCGNWSPLFDACKS